MPLRRVAVEAAFEDAAGARLPAFDSIHHRTETITGLGDVGLRLRIGLPDAGPWAVDLRAGLTAPTGGTEPDPFALGERGERHQHVFFGSGTWDPQLGVDATRPLGEWGAGAWLRARLPFDESGEGYRAGAQGSAGASLGRSTRNRRWSVRGQLELFHEEPSGWRGNPARNSGRTDLVLGAGLGFRPSGSPWLLQGLVRLPENLSARGGQIDLAPVVTLGASVTLAGRS